MSSNSVSPPWIAITTQMAAIAPIPAAIEMRPVEYAPTEYIATASTPSITVLLPGTPALTDTSESSITAAMQAIGRRRRQASASAASTAVGIATASGFIV